MSTAITVGLVGCASQKLKRPAPARELYVYQLFKKASAYAELTCDRWYLLSAKHGLVHPDTVLEPYDMRLGTNHRTSPPIHQWGARVKEQLDAELAGLANVTLVALAGEQYRIAVHNSRWPVEIPMKGLGIGQQLGWLTEKLSAGGHGSSTWQSSGTSRHAANARPRPSWRTKAGFWSTSATRIHFPGPSAESGIWAS
jgi:hypothetical protein